MYLVSDLFGCHQPNEKGWGMLSVAPTVCFCCTGSVWSQGVWHLEGTKFHKGPKFPDDDHTFMFLYKEFHKAPGILYGHFCAVRW